MRNPILFIAPAYNEAASLPQLVTSFADLLHRWNAHFLFVDDGSTDNSASVLASLAEANPRIAFASLSRNFGKEQALAAGFSLVPPGYDVLVMDADGQHGPAAVEELLQFAVANYEVDIVFGVRADRDYQSAASRLASALFYQAIKMLSSVRLDPRTGDFFFARSPVVEQFKRLSGKRTFFKALYGWMGYRHASVPVPISNRIAGRSKFSLIRKMVLAIDGVTSLTRRPLQLIALLGVVMFVVSIVMATWTLAQWILEGIVTPGYYTIVVLQTFFSGIILMALGVVAQYLGNIHENTSSRPSFLITQAHNVPAGPGMDPNSSAKSS